jgi:hypothetical protein
MVFANRAAQAQVLSGYVDYFDEGSINCTGANHCTGQWESITCTFGCIHGSCNSHANSTECCGKDTSMPRSPRTAAAQIYNVAAAATFELMPGAPMLTCNTMLNFYRTTLGGSLCSARPPAIGRRG